MTKFEKTAHIWGDCEVMVEVNDSFGVPTVTVQVEFAASAFTTNLDEHEAREIGLMLIEAANAASKRVDNPSTEP